MSIKNYYKTLKKLVDFWNIFFFVYDHLQNLICICGLEPPVARFNVRRKSVFAETYNPEDDDEDDGAKCIFPKSDEQRNRLAESVK